MARNSKSPPTPRSVMQPSWSIEKWPPDVFPNTVERARYIVRAYKDSLLAAGALARVGRELIVFGARYQRWMEKHAANVPDYENSGGFKG
jgi:hypothetical protein